MFLQWDTITITKTTIPSFNLVEMNHFSEICDHWDLCHYFPHIAHDIDGYRWTYLACWLWMDSYSISENVEFSFECHCSAVQVVFAGCQRYVDVDNTPLSLWSLLVSAMLQRKQLRKSPKIQNSLITISTTHSIADLRAFPSSKWILPTPDTCNWLMVL